MLSKENFDLESLRVVDLDWLGGKRVFGGDEVMTYGELDITSFGLGFSKGFLKMGGEKDGKAVARYLNWVKLREDGLEGNIYEHCELVRVLCRDFVGERIGILTEDLRDFDSVVLDHNDYQAGQSPDLCRVAAQWLSDFVGGVNGGDFRENLHGLVDRDLAAKLIWLVDCFGEGKHLPVMDPYVELGAIHLVERMKELGWRTGDDTFFIQVRRTGDEFWPYERRVLVGDMGEDLRKEGVGKVRTKRLFDCIGMTYFTGHEVVRR